jgi:GH15 family glucan-1,4-alpha-glucosidase
MCGVALDRGLRLADEVGFPAPVERWTATRAAIRAAVERHGYDPGRGVFTQAFGRPELDAALLLLPSTGFVAWDDPCMLRTVEAVRRELEVDGLLLRYRAPDGLEGTEGTFVACTFWLAECLARQARTAQAEVAFAKASAAANDLGLFAEEFDPATGTLLGNYPQALTHLSHIAAAVALEQTSGQCPPGPSGAGRRWRPERRRRTSAAGAAAATSTPSRTRPARPATRSAVRQAGPTA